MSVRGGTCMASALPACEPPLMMLNAGTGRMSFLLPARSDRCLYSGHALLRRARLAHGAGRQQP